jgi:predicted RNA-binding Zn ribbon-like protein
MALCGNRAKVAAHYQRRRKTQGEGSKSGRK